MSCQNINFLFTTTCVLLATLLTGCGPDYHTSVYNDPVYTQDKVPVDVLPEKGERYVRRGDILVDVSDIGPKSGEPYSRFRQRLLNTLATQEYQREQLKQNLDRKRISVTGLQGQADEMRQHNREMRLSLAGMQTIDRGQGSVPGIAADTHFSSYVVRKGDTLQKISKRIYGTHRGWLTLYRFNRSRLKNGPNRLEIGAELYVPSVQVLR